MTRQALRLLLRILLSAAAAFGAAAAIPAAAQGAPPARLLDVPYLPQTEDLCGGAAAAMVMRYWGARDLYADAFAPLVDHSAGGITTGALAGALRERGWIPIVRDGDAAAVQSQLQLGRPVIALIEDRPGRYHYVVVVSWAAARVIVQDPARAPLRNIDEASFVRAWAKAGRWMLVVLPPGGTRVADPPAEAGLDAPPAPPSCAALVDAGVGAANAGDRGAAGVKLRAAARACPESSAPPRELAGLLALEQKWPDAEREAARAVAIDSTDRYAWHLLASARYVNHDDAGALDAWNQAGEPRVDLVNVRGLTRTRYRIASDATGLEPREMLTRGAMRLAERRLRDVPAFGAANVSYRPLEDGRAQVDVAIAERDLVPAGYAALIAAGLEAGADRSLSGSVASPTGGGELLTATWRWWANRPGAWVSFAAPAPFRLGGVWRVDASRESQAFGVPALQETRSHAGFAYARWMTARVKLEGDAGVDAWAGHGRTAMTGVRVEFWPLLDRFAVTGGATAWPGTDRRFAVADVTARWRSTTAPQGTVWLARASLQAATGQAPAFVWPGADTGHARDVLLRAHPLLDQGVITGGVFGRRLAGGGLEWQRWSRPSKWLVRVAPAAFLDIARATDGLVTTDERIHVDAGAGVRVSLAGMGVLRVDLAHGLRDGRTALSVAIER